MGGFLILILIFGVIWLLFVLPARRRRMSHSAMQDTIEAGDDVITAGGIHGTVRDVNEDLMQVEIAPGVVVQVDRRAIAAVAREVDVEVERETDPEAPPDIEAEVKTDHGASEEPS